MSDDVIDAEFTVRAQEAVMQAADHAKQVAHEPKAVPDQVERNVRVALQHAIERGKLRPFEAIEAAEHFGIRLEDWVYRQHEHYSQNNGRPS